ncbi:MAG: TlpA family protein disulfide reductase [Gammaproteobacteria bacterium]|nr:TlpA family protein disulfide reductase [Gammaproteobacteria bacterium]
MLFCLLFNFSVLAVEVGETAPDFTLKDIEAGKADFTLSDLRGKTVYLDFWASWCGPCLRSLPLYNELYSKYREKGLVVVGINIDNPIEDGLDFLLDNPLDFKIPSDPDGEVTALYEIYGMPTSYLIDAEGVVHLVHEGFRDGDLELIEKEIEALLAH